MNYSKLLKKVEEYTAAFYAQHADERIVFSTYARAKEVAFIAEKIARHYKLDDRLFFIVCASAWFHKTGYLTGILEAYETKSAEIAENFLKSSGATEEDINEIKKCIVSTRKPGDATGLPAKILCDVNTFWLGSAHFKEDQKLLRKELEGVKNHKIGGHEWRAEIIKMMESHHFLTDYCTTLLNKTKEENLNRLKSKQAEKSFAAEPEPVAADDTDEGPAEQTIPGRNKKPNNPDKKPTRGIETMFRVTSSNSQKISMMADNKAHIMISVNSIIMSAILGLIIGKLDNYRYLIFPTIILLLTNVATIIYSILATRPKATRGVFTPEQVENKSVNLLFYGSFYNMELKEYDYGMRKMMEDRYFLYGSLIKDTYWQGKVLGRKYKLLRISYSIFMFGIAVSVIAFTIAALIHVY
ncbi:Pycsar system effector family protein [Segetibacter aerophilus]|uniref:Pycsar effector protein domain-containing protein n=1 Tax=Segetibacter aerophilus TaxID=670293 RepID=A0A512BHH6_9BACT|nr:Pycsar system effector family protein [Segetibacter aerophilus]GEO11410.1 hypothetical protein SAE01_39060 [Segetibacter aerophilus]